MRDIRNRAKTIQRILCAGAAGAVLLPTAAFAQSYYDRGMRYDPGYRYHEPAPYAGRYDSDRIYREAYDRAYRDAYDRGYRQGRQDAGRYGDRRFMDRRFGAYDRSPYDRDYMRWRDEQIARMDREYRDWLEENWDRSTDRGSYTDPTQRETPTQSGIGGTTGSEAGRVTGSGPTTNN